MGADDEDMPLNLNVAAVGAVMRPAQALKSSAKGSAVAPERGDTAEVSGRGAVEPAPEGFGLAEARAALASLTQDMTAAPRKALAAQANVRPHVGIVLAG
jgi:hypothetical protein